MRKIITYLALALLLLVTPSCDSFLDITPVGKVIPTTYEEFRALLTQGYDYMPKNGGARTSFRSDEVGAFTNATDRSNYIEEWRWNDLDPEYTSSFGWRQYYQALFIANYVIESEATIKEGTDEERSQLVGEAYALRAYIHFVLVNLYGEHYAPETLASKAVPLKLNTKTDEALLRNTVGEIYEAIEQDIAAAAERMNQTQWETGYNYRFSLNALEAFESRYYLYKGEWQKSLNHAQTLMNGGCELADISTSLGNINTYNGVESILALEYLDNAMTKAIYIASDLYALYNANDNRAKAYYSASGGGRYTVRKGGSNTFASTFRTAELYLNAAEAAYRLNQPTEARDYLLQLKKKRYRTTAYADEATRVNALEGDALLAEILDERLRELAFEGHRWFDLRRTTQPALTKTEGEESYQLNAGDARYTIRIPQEAIDSNPNLSN